MGGMRSARSGRCGARIRLVVQEAVWCADRAPYVSGQCCMEAVSYLVELGARSRYQPVHVAILASHIRLGRRSHGPRIRRPAMTQTNWMGLRANHSFSALLTIVARHCHCTTKHSNSTLGGLDCYKVLPDSVAMGLSLPSRHAISGKPASDSGIASSRPVFISPQIQVELHGEVNPNSAQKMLSVN